MAEFNPFAALTNPPASQYNPFANIQAAKQPANNPERDRVLLPLATERSQEEVDTMLATGQGNNLVQSARQRAIDTQWSRVERTIDRNFNQGLTPEESAIQLSELVAQDPFVGRFIDPVVMSTILRSDNDIAKRSYLDRFQRVLILNDLITTRFQNQEAEGTLNKVIDFIDNFVAVPVYANFAANARADFAGEITRLLDSNIPPEQFTARVNEMFDQVADQGWLTEDNQYLLYELFDLIPEGGEGPKSDMSALWATFDTVAGGLGIAGTVRSGVAIGKGMARSMTEVATDASTLAARSGAEPEVIQDMLTSSALRDAPGGPVNPINHEPSIVTPLNRRYGELTPPESIARSELEDVNPFIRNVTASIARGGQAVDDTLIDALRRDRVFQSEEAARRAVIDYDLHVDNLENVYYTETFGNKAGQAFTRRTDAVRLANRLGAEVVDVGESKWQVKLTVPVPYSDALFAKTNIQELGDGFWARYGTPQAQTTDDLASMLYQSESIATKLVDELKQAYRQIGKLTDAKGRRAVGKVFDDLRDGDESWRRNYYSTEEFKAQFFKQNAREATPQEVEYADMVQKINNLDYQLKADSMFKEAVSRNTRVLKIDDTDNLVSPAKAEDLPAGEIVWNLDTKELMDVSKLTERHNVFSMASDLFKTLDGDWVQYVVTKKPTTRRIYPSDVMPYNAGGPRQYNSAEMKFFVKQSGERTLASGRTVNEVPKTFMATRLQEEAQATVDQLNTIIAEIDSRLGKVPKTLDETYEAIRGMDLDELITNNSDWNINIHTTDDLIEFFRDNMIDPRKGFSWSPDGEAIGDVVASFAPRNATYADVFRLSGNRKLGRRNKPLVGYGGLPVTTRPAVESIKRSALQTVATKSTANYIVAATHGIIKEVAHLHNLHLKNPSNAKILNGKVALEDLRGLTLKGKLATLMDGISDTAEGRKLKLEIQKIMSRTTLEDPINTGFQRLKNYLADVEYKTSRRVVTTKPTGTPVKLFRGTKSGVNPSDLQDGGRFLSPNRSVAEAYAGKTGQVLEETVYFNKLLEAENWVEAKAKIGLGKADDMPTLIRVAKESGYDGITFTTKNGKEYIALNPSSKSQSKIEVSPFVSWMDSYSSNPVTAARGYVFDMVLGLFAPDQYYVQASQIFNIVGTHPITGIKGAALYGPLRFLVRNGKESTIRSFADKIGPIMGLTSDQFVEMTQMLRQDGRMVTGVSVAELQDDVQMLGMFDNIREKGRFFFNEGELVGRITAHATAYMEFIKKFPDVAPMSQQGRRWIAREQDRLTQSMTGASSSAWQRMPFAQFLTYSWRITEQIASGWIGGGKKILSNKEKARLGLTHMGIFGVAGIPAGAATFDYFYHKYGMEIPEQWYTPIRYGVLDTVLSSIIGTDTAMSNRLAWGTGITDTIRNLASANFMEALAGPVGSVGGDLITNLTNLYASVKMGSSEMVKADLNNLARQIKSYDMAHNVYWATILGNYYSRSGAGIVDDDVDAHERVALAFGIPLQDYIERNTLDRLSYADSQFEKKTGTRIEQMLTAAIAHYEQDEYAEGDGIRDMVQVMLDAIRMNDPAQAERILNNMPRSFESLVDEAMYRAIQRGYQTREELQ